MQGIAFNFMRIERAYGPQSQHAHGMLPTPEKSKADNPTKNLKAALLQCRQETYR
jgi:hypothetical protein